MKKLIRLLRKLKAYDADLNRRAQVEIEMFRCVEGKKPMPDKEKLRKWALDLGIPEEYRIKQPKESEV